MLDFPASFRFGTATSATQIEGHCDTSDWSAFAREPGRIHGGDTPDVACDAWNRFRDDVAIQRELGMDAHRLGLEWARLEPRPGEWDDAAWERYREMLGALRDAAILPMVTLHHFTLPRWLARMGGVVHPEYAGRFVRFARRAIEVLGDLCDHWITINEPNVLIAFGYVTGVWPPARTSIADAFRAHRSLGEAHRRSYRAIKDDMGRRGREAIVGLAHHLRHIEPERPERAGDRAFAAVYRRVFNDAFLREVIAEKTQDFLGVNYYSRDLVRPSSRAKDGFLRRDVPARAETSDLGWEIFPEGLGEVLDRWAPRAGVPVWITENGIADATDAKRPRFLVAHLAELARAIDRGIDVRGYLHWSLLDNFEWAEGYAPRFGLVGVDFATQTRTIRPSARLYARIARGRRLDDDALALVTPRDGRSAA